VCSTEPLNDNREKELMREMTLDGAAVRYSEYSRYPLPAFPAQMAVKMDRYDRYVLPHPVTGVPTSFTRATTVSNTTSDHYMLERWKIRTKVAAVVKAVTLCNELIAGTSREFSPQEMWGAALVPDLYRLLEEDPTEKGLGRHIDLIDDVMGGADAKELGGAVHDWIAELDMGRVLLHQIPDQFQVYAANYQRAMASAGLIAVGEYTERVVLNDRGTEMVAGRIDGIARNVDTGKLHILDRKTKACKEYTDPLALSALEFGIQIGGVYGWATKMLNEAGTGWDPMPDIDHEIAYIAHIPSDAPEKSTVVPIRMWPGGESMITALTVREERRGAKKAFFGEKVPAPSKKALRYVHARQALQQLTSKEDAENIALEYLDVVDDDLIAFGAQCLELLTATTEKEN
jgi:hypothetical protein